MSGRDALGSAFDPHTRAADAPPRGGLDRSDKLAILATFAGGVVFGLALHYADSMPPDLIFIGILAKVVVGIGLILGGAASTIAYAGGQPRNLLIALALLGGTIVGYPFGPSIVAGVGVPGTYSMTFTDPPGTAAIGGVTRCDWANGRGKVARLTSEPFHFTGSELTLTVDFYGSRVSLDIDADKSQPAYVRFGPEAMQPAGGDAPARRPDDSAGSIHLDLVRNVADEAGPAELVGSLIWQCQPAPPG